jgi:hypothetical protein
MLLDLHHGHLARCFQPVEYSLKVPMVKKLR